MQPVCFVLLISSHPSIERTHRVCIAPGVCSMSALGGTLDVSRQELSYSSQETILDGLPLDHAADAMYAGEYSKEMTDSTILYRMLE